MRNITPTKKIDRIRADVDRDFQQKRRVEFESIPDTKLRRRGERDLYIPNKDDNYAIVNTRDGWKVLQFLTVETAIPLADVGQNGEIRVLRNGELSSLLFKVNDIWHELNYDAIISSTHDIAMLSTAGWAPLYKTTAISLATGGVTL